MRSLRRLPLSLAVLFLAALSVAFAIPSASAEQPVIVYETAVPANFLPSGRGITVDGDGNSYVVGADYADQVHLDIVVLKVAPDGQVLWTRFIQGDDHDYSQDIALDLDGNVWITGWTDSDDYPVTAGALQSTLTGFRDVVLTKLSGEDGSILYSTLLGGDYTDRAQGIAINAAGEIILVGSTGSTDYPTTADAYQSEPSAPLYIYTDAFITKLNAAGDTILYSTYFGGFEDDGAENVALDQHGNIVFSGHTTADDLPLAQPIQSAPNGMFISKLSADGSTLQFSTYLGGEDYDRLRSMDIDAAGYVYLAGSTRSVSFPITAGAYQEQFAGEILGCGSPPFEPRYNCDDGFVTKLATDGSGLVYSTYLGGTSIEECHGVAVDAHGEVHVTGKTSSTDFPGTTNPGLIFVSKLSADGSELRYTLRKQSPYPTYAITTDDLDDVYVTGAVDLPANIYVARLDGGETAGIETAAASSPSTPALRPSSPNPFSVSTRIAYELPGAGGRVQLDVYDAAGRLVRNLIDADERAGQHAVSWDGRDDRGTRVANGTYFYQLQWNGQRQTGRVLVVR
jgi:hypothetical protein